MTWLLVFAAMFAFEVLWVLCIRALNADHAIRASLYGAGTWGVTGLATFNYVNDPWLIVPTMLGAAAGTYFTMRCKWTSQD